MRVSIQARNNVIVVDGKIMTTDCSTLLQKNIWAIQWVGDWGEIEFAEHKRFNERFTDFKPYQKYVDKAVMLDPLKPLPTG